MYLLPEGFDVRQVPRARNRVPPRARDPQSDRVKAAASLLAYRAEDGLSRPRSTPDPLPAVRQQASSTASPSQLYRNGGIDTFSAGDVALQTAGGAALGGILR